MFHLSVLFKFIMEKVVRDALESSHNVGVELLDGEKM